MLHARYLGAAVLGALLSGAIFAGLGVYRRLPGTTFGQTVRAGVAWTATFSVLLAMAYLLKIGESFSRGWALTWFVGNLVLMTCNRVALRTILKRLQATGKHASRCLIIGATHSGNRLLQTFDGQAIGLDIAGYLTTDHDQSSLDNVTCLGDLSRLQAVLGEDSWDQVWIALPLHARHELSFVLDATRDSALLIRFLPDMAEYELLNHRVETFEGIPTITLRSNLLDGDAWVTKAISDRVLASLILLGISPLMLIVAAAIKLTSPGPVFFKQGRHGYSGKPFDMWKFRSMRVHKEAAGTVTQAQKGDNRITKLGKFLRATSLDELPQLINVIKGDMSLVGPRPHAIAHNHYYKDKVQQYMQRHHMKPGITGWAQINGMRGETDTLEKMERRVELDIYYIMNWSVRLDFMILVKTIYKGFIHKNAR
jgi:Undecaprenyl-phosphate glucose phosphotransferase